MQHGWVNTADTWRGGEQATTLFDAGLLGDDHGHERGGEHRYAPGGDIGADTRLTGTWR